MFILFAYSHYLFKAYAQGISKDQSDALFKVIVQVTDNVNVNHMGTIYVAIDGINQSKVMDDISFSSEKTVSHTFELNSFEIPIVKGFTAEVVYNDDIFKRTYGFNIPTKSLEIAKIMIP